MLNSFYQEVYIMRVKKIVNSLNFTNIHEIDVYVNVIIFFFCTFTKFKTTNKFSIFCENLDKLLVKIHII